MCVQVCGNAADRDVHVIHICIINLHVSGGWQIIDATITTVSVSVRIDYQCHTYVSLGHGCWWVPGMSIECGSARTCVCMYISVGQVSAL